MKELQKQIIHFQSFLPLSSVMEKSLKDFLDVKYSYNSNAIEGTTLTEQETSLVLRGQTIPKHSLVEHLEVINHKKAFDFVFELAGGFGKKDEKFIDIFTEKNILQIHEYILRGIYDECAGIYRRQNVRIAFSRAVLPRFEKIPELMMQFVKNIQERSKNIDLNDFHEILKLGADIHLDFVKIHPFVDGNGRTARLIMNLWFLYAVGNINIIYFKNRDEYIESLENHTKAPEKYFECMNKNFSEFKQDELQLLDNNEIYKY